MTRRLTLHYAMQSHSAGKETFLENLPERGHKKKQALEIIHLRLNKILTSITVKVSFVMSTCLNHCYGCQKQLGGNQITLLVTSDTV